MKRAGGLTDAAQIHASSSLQQDMKTWISSLLQILCAACASAPAAVDAPRETSSAAQPLAPAASRYPHLGIPEISGVPDISAVEITLVRTPCYGMCPSYKLSLRGDGHGTYRGDRFVTHRGEIPFQFDPAILDELLSRLDSLNFLEMTHDDAWFITDIPSEIITLKVGARQRSFDHRWDGDSRGLEARDARFHVEIERIARWIDESVGVKQWVGPELDREARMYPARCR